MEIQKYLEEKKSIQSSLLSFLDEESFNESSLSSLIQLFEDQQIREKPQELKELFYLVSQIANNHHQSSDFYDRIDKILLSFEKELKDNLTNWEKFHIFKGNKRVLLFLIQNDLMTIDQSIASIILNSKYRNQKYPHYFYPEVKSYIADERYQKEIEDAIEKSAQVNSDSFEQKRLAGQNEGPIFRLIREDDVDGLSAFLLTNKLSLFNSIEPSLFETNPLLQKRPTTFLEYSAFFGSSRVFSYLKENKSKITSELWLYAIHGESVEIIESLAAHPVRPNDRSYAGCLVEALKSHSQSVVELIVEKFLQLQDESKNRVLAQSVKFYNYRFFPEDLNTQEAFCFSCHADNISLLSEIVNVQKKNFKINNQISSVFCACLM